MITVTIESALKTLNNTHRAVFRKYLSLLNTKLYLANIQIYSAVPWDFF